MERVDEVKNEDYVDLTNNYSSNFHLEKKRDGETSEQLTEATYTCIQNISNLMKQFYCK